MPARSWEKCGRIETASSTASNSWPVQHPLEACQDLPLLGRFCLNRKQESTGRGVLKRVNLVIFSYKRIPLALRAYIQDTKTKTEKNAFDPWYGQLKVFEKMYKCWKFFVVSNIFFLLKMPCKKNSVQILFWNFLKISLVQAKTTFWRLSLLGLRKCSKFSDQFFLHRIFCQDILRRNFLGSTENFQHL